MFVQSEISEDELRNKLKGIPAIYEVVLTNSSVIIGVGTAEMFKDQCNSGLKFVTVPVLNLRDGSATQTTMNVDHVLLISPTRNPADLFEPKPELDAAAAPGVVWKNNKVIN